MTEPAQRMRGKVFTFKNIPGTFQRQCAKLISNISKNFFGFGVLKHLAQLAECPIYFQKTLHPTVLLPTFVIIDDCLVKGFCPPRERV